VQDQVLHAAEHRAALRAALGTLLLQQRLPPVRSRVHAVGGVRLPLLLPARLQPLRLLLLLPPLAVAAASCCCCAPAAAASRCPQVRHESAGPAADAPAGRCCGCKGCRCTLA
jgi:hypothetical protein